MVKGTTVKKKATKQKKEKIDPNIESIYETEVTFTCPVRGLVKQKVKVKKYKSQMTQERKVLLDSDNDLISKIDDLDDTLSTFGTDEAADNSE